MARKKKEDSLLDKLKEHSVTQRNIPWEQKLTEEQSRELLEIKGHIENSNITISAAYRYWTAEYPECRIRRNAFGEALRRIGDGQ